VIIKIPVHQMQKSGIVPPFQRICIDLVFTWFASGSVAIQNGNQFVHLFANRQRVVGLGGLPDAVIRVSFQYPKFNFPQGGADRPDLGQQIDTVAFFFDHPNQSANLALDALQPVELLVMGSVFTH